MFPEMSHMEITKKLEVLRLKQRQINVEIANLEEMKSRKLSEDFNKWSSKQSSKKDIYDPYPTVRF